MLHSILVWLGFATPKNDAHGSANAYGHKHGVIDSTLAIQTPEGVAG